MTWTVGLGTIPSSWKVKRARWLLDRRRRPVGIDDSVVTAFRNGRVTLRSNRRLDGYTEAIQEIGYQGVRTGDLVVHSMDGFAGAIGVSDAAGKVSPVVHVYTSWPDVDVRFVTYVLRTMALNGFVASLAKGVRERSTAFDAATLANISLPVPPIDEQRLIADFLDGETARIDALAQAHSRLRNLIFERTQRAIDLAIEGSEEPVPLRYMVRFREGPGIMASDFLDEGVPLIRLGGLRDGHVTLRGCNYLDPGKVAHRWSQFRLKTDDRLISGSATMGEVSVVRDQAVVGAVPYTGLIILRPARPEVSMDYIEAFLRSSFFTRQIDVLKTGAALQHYGPTHLSQVQAPFPSRADQDRVTKIAQNGLRHRTRAEKLVDRQLSLLTERREALITAAVTGQFDVSSASGRGVTE